MFSRVIVLKLMCSVPDMWSLPTTDLPPKDGPWPKNDYLKSDQHIKVKVHALEKPHQEVHCITVVVHTLTPHPGTLLRTHPTLGVSILSSEPSHHCDGIRGLPISWCPSSVLPHRAGTNFTPWRGEAVDYEPCIVLRRGT